MYHSYKGQLVYLFHYFKKLIAGHEKLFQFQTGHIDEDLKFNKTDHTCCVIIFSVETKRDFSLWTNDQIDGLTIKCLNLFL